jgi:metallo-beta-lactamase family protein
MTISFYGAAQTVTGSKHLITTAEGIRILLDCGMFQGKGNHYEQLNRNFDFEPANIDYVVLSHAHIDHSGLLPALIKGGYEGKIFCTPPTLELCQLLLRDSARIQNGNLGQEDLSGEEPVYSEEDVEETLSRFVTLPYEEPYTLQEGIRLYLTDTGHILGSAAVHLTIVENNKERTLCFSGDIGRFANRILKAPQPFPQAEIIICESTYGSKLHSNLENTETRLGEIVEEVCIKRKGKLLIPAFSVGRTQELVYSLNYLAEEGRLPNVSVFVDSPLSVYATDVMRSNPEHFNETMKEYIEFDPDPFGFKNLYFVTDVEDSKMVQAMTEPCVIISSSGMMEAGRIRHHLKDNLPDPNSAVLITGYCDSSTLGGKLQQGAKKVTILGEEVEVAAEIMNMNEYSAHGDFSDISKFLFCQDKEKLKKIFLVHGEADTMKQLQADLKEQGYKDVEIPDFRMSYDV